MVILVHQNVVIWEVHSTMVSGGVRLMYLEYLREDYIIHQCSRHAAERSE